MDDFWSVIFMDIATISPCIIPGTSRLFFMSTKLACRRYFMRSFPTLRQPVTFVTWLREDVNNRQQDLFLGMGRAALWPLEGTADSPTNYSGQETGPCLEHT